MRQLSLTRSLCGALAATALLSTACRDTAAAPVDRAAPEIAAAGGDGPGLSGPFAHENLQVWLVHGEDRAPAGTKFVPLEDAIADGTVLVHETGNVNELAVENTSEDVTVWIQAGDVVQGGQQDRTIGVDIALAPGSGRVPVASFCVEQGRWSVRGAEVQTMDNGAGWIAEVAEEALVQTDDAQLEQVTLGNPAMAPSSDVTFRVASNNVSTLQIKKAVLLDLDQSEVWQEVAVSQFALSKNAGAVVDPSSPTSWELTMESDATKEARTAYVDALLASVDGSDDVVGCVFAIDGKLDSADVYGSRDLFRRMWPKLLRGAAVAALTTEGKTATDAIRADDVRAFLADAEGDPVHQREVADHGEMVTGQNPHGFVVESRRATDETWLHRAYLAK